MVAFCDSRRRHRQFMRALASYVLPAESGRLQNKIAGRGIKDTMRRKNVVLCAAAGRYRFAARRNPVEFGCAWGRRGADPAELLCPGPRAACCLAYRETR
jgi:hypothetical protein